MCGAHSRPLHDPRSGITYVGKVGPTPTDARFEKKYLTALDEQGNEKWTFPGASMTSDPVLDLEGRVCFRSRDRLHAVDADGREVWSVPTSDASRWDPPFDTREAESLFGDLPFKMAPHVAADGTVYVVAADDALGFKNCRLMAVRDGREQWSRRLTSPSSSVEVAGTDAVLRETVEAPKPPPSLLERIFSPREDPSYTQRITRLDPQGAVRYSTLWGDSVTQSWSDDFPTARFAAGPDGSAYICRGDGLVAALASDGSPAWMRETGPTASDGKRHAWILTDPLTDSAGNVYVTTSVRDPQNEHVNGVHAVKLAPDGATRYDVIVGTYPFKDLAPVLTPKGELVVVTESRDGGIARVEEEHVTVVAPDGRITQDLVCTSTGVGNWNTENGLIRSLAPGRDGELIVELEPYYYTSPGGRSIVAVPTDRPDPKAAVDPVAPANPAGTVEVQDEQVVIGGVKIPRRQ